MFGLNIQDCFRRNQQLATPVAARVPEGLFALIANLFTAFTSVDPRVITRQERHNGRTAPGF
jgi:hypothetical protein